MTVIALTETGWAPGHRLSTEQARALIRSNLVEVRPDGSSGLWQVRSRGYVGVARVGDVEVRIAPKLAVDRLLFLVGYATSGRHWRPEEVPYAPADGLVPVLAEALWRQVDQALRQGLLQGYRVVDDSSPVLRGRLREVAQMHRHQGQPWPLEVSYDEFTVDIPENRILRTACERMLRVPRVDPAVRLRLRRLAHRLADAEALPAGAPVPRWRPHRLNARYQPALRLAELVLRATSIEYGEGGVAVHGLLLDMPKVFQDFLTTALREALEPTYGGRVRREPDNALDVAGRVVMKPDIVWYRGGQPAAVADAKYKVESVTADLYQLLAYCTTLPLPRGHLVYAAGTTSAAAPEPRVYVVRNAGVEIVCHALDLAAPPAGVLARVRALADRLAWDADGPDRAAGTGRPSRAEGAAHGPAAPSDLHAVPA